MFCEFLPFEAIGEKGWGEGIGPKWGGEDTAGEGFQFVCQVFGRAIVEELLGGFWNVEAEDFGVGEAVRDEGVCAGGDGFKDA